MIWPMATSSTLFLIIIPLVYSAPANMVFLLFCKHKTPLHPNALYLAVPFAWNTPLSVSHCWFLII